MVVLFFVVDLSHVKKELRKCDDNDGIVVIRHEQNKNAHATVSLAGDM